MTYDEAKKQFTSLFNHEMSDEEMREVIGQLEQTKQPRTCPHGRPTMIHRSSRQLEKEFGRVK